MWGTVELKKKITLGGGQALFSPVFYQGTPQREARSSILASRWRLYYISLSLSLAMLSWKAATKVAHLDP